MEYITFVSGVSEGDGDKMTSKSGTEGEIAIDRIFIATCSVMELTVDIVVAVFQRNVLVVEMMSSDF